MIPRRLLPQTVTIAPYVGDGAYGPVWGTAYTVPARVEHTNQLVRDRSGNEVVARSTIFIQPRAVLPEVGSKVTVPDGSTWPVIAVAEHVGSDDAEVVTLHTS